MIPLAALLAFVWSPLPDPLVSSSGFPVASAAAWPGRRAELAAIVQNEGIGHLPPPPAGLKAEILRTETIGESRITYRLVRLSWQSDPAFSFVVAVFVPAHPIAVVLHPSFGGTPGAEPPPWYDPAYYKSATPEQFAAERRDVLDHGYALLTYYYQEAAADRKDNRQTGFYRGFPHTDAGTLAVWAWGVSRAADYLVTQPFGPIVVVGHSRLGKTALIAGAFDERIAVVVAAGSGAGGTGAFRVSGKARAGKEGLEEVTHHFAYWFGPRLPTYVGRVASLPYDAHDLMAMVAPRALLDTEAYGDKTANTQAAVVSYRAAMPVYHLLGADDRLGLNFRQGGHALTDDDWQAVLDFADHQLTGAPAHRPFHNLPDDTLLH